MVDSYSADPLDRYFVVGHAAVRNDKSIQEALAEICHSDASWLCGDIASRSFCVVRPSLVELELKADGEIYNGKNTNRNAASRNAIIAYSGTSQYRQQGSPAYRYLRCWIVDTPDNGS